MLGPNSKKRNTVIHFGGFQQTSSCFCAFPVLAQFQHPQIIGGCCPELPGDHTGGVPGGVLVGFAITQEIAVPAETINGLAADAAMSRSM